MTTALKESARRVQEYLDHRGFSFEVKELTGSTRTAMEAAESVGCDVAQIAKSLIFRDKETDQPVLVIASGANRVDLKKVGRATGLKLGRADGNYVKERVGYAIGGVPPVAHNTQLRTLLDPDLRRHATIWAAAGTPHALFQLDSGSLETLTSGTWVDLSE